MEKILYAELNIVCIVICLLMLFNLVRRYERINLLEQRIFVLLLISDIVILLADTGNWVIGGIQTDLAVAANTACSVIYYVFNPLICLLWLIYADYELFHNWEKLKARLKYYVVPALISGAMALASPVTGWFFITDAENNYCRGSLFWVMVLASLVYLVLPAALTLLNMIRYGIIHSSIVYGHLLLFPIILGTAVVVQVMNFGVSVIWAATTLSILSAFISMQNADIVLDHLTGIYNRRRLDAVIPVKMKSRRPGHLLFLIMADINDFKRINDEFGHLTGDKALKQAAKILRESCGGTEVIVARYGGDEFVILGECSNHGNIEELMSSIECCTADFNANSGVSYRLSFSMGLAVCENTCSVQEFLEMADRDMYRKKEMLIRT